MKSNQINDIKSLLSQTNSLVKSYEKLAKITGENFNIFSVMRAESDEVRTHSRIIAEFLNPRGIHNQGSVYLKLFFKEINSLNDFKENFDYENAQVLVEEHIGRIDDEYSEGGYIDIVIKDAKNQVVIENKIYAGDQKGQLWRYKKNYPSCKLIYLTLNGKEPSEFSYKIKKGEGLKLEDIILVSYRDEIKNWIEKCLEKTHSLPIIRETLVQYLHLIKKLTNQTTNSEMAEEVKELIKGNYLASQEIHNNFYEAKQEIVKEFWGELKTKVEEDLSHVEDLKHWFVEINEFEFDKRFNYILLGNTSSKGKCYFYFRYNSNNFETLNGIMIDPEFKHQSKKGVKGKTINEELELTGYSGGDISIIYPKSSFMNFQDKIIAEIVLNSKKVEILNQCAETILEYVKENKELFEKIYSYMNTVELRTI